jgi:hypothetical protein
MLGHQPLVTCSRSDEPAVVGHQSLVTYHDSPSRILATRLPYCIVPFFTLNFAHEQGRDPGTVTEA